MTPVRRLSLVAAVAVAALTGSSPLDAQTDRPEVARVSFEGNRVINGDSLGAAIATRATRCRFFVFRFVPPLCPLGWDPVIEREYLNPRELRLDVSRLVYYYVERGYRDVAVDTAMTGANGRVEVTFRIEEGEPVRVDSLEVLLLDPIPDSSAIRDLPLAAGDPLSAILMDASRDSVEARLRNQGFAWADVLLSYFIPSDAPRSARVTLDIDPGPPSRFGAISVEGTESLEEESVRRMLPFRAGSGYRRDQIVEGQRNLYSLDIIQSAVIEEVRDGTSRDTLIPIRVRISESTLRRVRAELGWTTADCLTAEARWASRNFYGGARRLEVRARVSNILAPNLNATACPQAGSGSFAQLNGQLAMELVQPWIFSPRSSLSASVFVERQSLPEVFIREAIGFELGLRRSIGRRASVTLSYQPQLTRLEAAEVFFCASFLTCLPSEIDAFRGANWLAPIGLNVVRDRRNSVLDPTRGYFTVLDLEHAAEYTGSNFAYNRAVGLATVYRPLAGGVGAARLRVGVVGGGRFEELGGSDVERLIHPQKRFYAGGANSVRGFGENRLGPRVLTADVSRLLGVPEDEEATDPVCLPEEIVPFGCDPSALPDGAFSPRAVGGAVVVEGNVEYRVPLTSSLQGVGFLDFGNVWLDASEVDLGDLEATPGLGIRYLSPIGPIRVDLAYRFRAGELLPVATSGIREFDPEGDDPDDRIQVRMADGNDERIPWVRTDELTFLARQTPFGADPSFFSRLQLHFSIGQAF